MGIQGEGLFIFRDLGGRVIYFQGFGEKAQLFGVLGSREQGAEEKHFRELGRKVIFFFQGAGGKVIGIQALWCYTVRW